MNTLLSVFACLLICTFAIQKTIVVKCATGSLNGVQSQNCAKYGMEVDGVLNPDIHCQDKDQLTFSIDSASNISSFTIYLYKSSTNANTKLTTDVVNNGGNTNVVLTCSTAYVAHSAQFPLRYTVEDSISTTGFYSSICVGTDACDAPVCTDVMCWGSPTTTPTVDTVKTTIQTLAGDFAYYLTTRNYASTFEFGATTDATKGFSVAFTFTTSSEANLRSELVSVLADQTGVDQSWFTLSSTAGDSASGYSALLYVFNPSDKAPTPALAGYVDLLFFYESAASIDNLGTASTCRIHSTCRSYYTSYYYGRGSTSSCYSYLNSNLVGEYSDNNHIQENQCVKGVTSDWDGYITVKINADRQSGSYSAGCNADCSICKHTGSYTGDDCSCWQDPGLLAPTYCISVKYASSSVIFPSLFVFVSFLSLLFN